MTKPVKQKIKAGDVERAVVDWFRHRGGWARVITVSGIPVSKSGRILRWRPNHQMRGMADVYAMLAGISYRIEVKVGKDSESADQIRDRLEWEQAGGRSMIVKTVDDFLEQMEVVLL